MKLLLSGATNYMVEQNDVNKSLGGFMSSTRVPNGRLNSLFTELSNYDIKQKIKTTLAIFLYNDTDKIIENITMECLYQQKFGKYLNLSDFEFSISEPTENGAIELIGSSMEEPFYSDFFECESNYENCILEVKTPGNIGDIFSMYGHTQVISGNTLSNFQNDIIKLLTERTPYTVEKVDDTKIFIRSNALGTITNEKSNFNTNGYASLVSDNKLKNGKDGLTLISESLEPGKSIGIWIKRTINDNYKNLQFDCSKPLSELENFKEPDKKETFKIIFHND